MNVDLYTDASIYGGEGGWATVIIRGDEEPVEYSGKLRGYFGSSTAVEAAAIANGLHQARKAGLVERGDTVTVRSDNMNALHRLTNGNKRKCDPMIRKAIDHVLKLAADIGVELAAEWVKGHQTLDTPDPHAIYNRRCDELCSAARTGVPVSRTLDKLVTMHRTRVLRAEIARARGVEPNHVPMPAEKTVRVRADFEALIQAARAQAIARIVEAAE